MRFVDYLEVFESRITAKEGSLKQGTLTMFDGLCFDEENPYTHREAKRLLALLREELRGRKEVQSLGVHPDAKGRSAITGRGLDSAWDFLPVVAAAEEQPHTANPHLTINLSRDDAVAAVTVPNSVRGGFRTKLEKIQRDGFRNLMADLECRLRNVVTRSPGARPMLYIMQRHYPSQRSPAVVDGRLEVDLRTMTGCRKAGVKCQPEWVDTAYHLLTHKRSNIQLGVTVHFQYSCNRVRSPKVVDLFVDTWVALRPLLDFALQRV